MNTNSINAIKNKTKFEDDLAKYNSIRSLDTAVIELFHEYARNGKIDLARELISTYFDELELVTITGLFSDEYDAKIVFPFDNDLCQNKFKMEIVFAMYQSYIKMKSDFSNHCFSELVTHNESSSMSHHDLRDKIEQLEKENEILKDQIIWLSSRLDIMERR